jgi:hypothetical protein
MTSWSSVRPGCLMGNGRLPGYLRASLTGADEDMLVLLEELPATVTYRRFRDYDAYHWWKQEWVKGAVAITDQRLVVWSGGRLHIRTPHAHPLRATIVVTAEFPDHVCFSYEAGITNPSITGHAEVRLRTSRAAHITGLLNRLAARD